MNSIIRKVKKNGIVKQIISVQTYSSHQIDHKKGVHPVVLAACR